jgi:hypothetical protein
MGSRRKVQMCTNEWLMKLYHFSTVCNILEETENQFCDLYNNKSHLVRVDMEHVTSKLKSRFVWLAVSKCRIGGYRVTDGT